LSFTSERAWPSITPSTAINARGDDFCLRREVSDNRSRSSSRPHGNNMNAAAHSNAAVSCYGGCRRHLHDKDLGQGSNNVCSALAAGGDRGPGGILGLLGRGEISAAIIITAGRSFSSAGACTVPEKGLNMHSCIALHGRGFFLERRRQRLCLWMAMMRAKLASALYGDWLLIKRRRSVMGRRQDVAAC
jgi:hypothetical protein